MALSAKLVHLYTQREVAACAGSKNHGLGDMIAPVPMTAARVVRSCLFITRASEKKRSAPKAIGHMAGQPEER